MAWRSQFIQKRERSFRRLVGLESVTTLVIFRMVFGRMLLTTAVSTTHLHLPTHLNMKMILSTSRTVCPTLIPIWETTCMKLKQMCKGRNLCNAGFFARQFLGKAVKYWQYQAEIKSKTISNGKLLL
jgi:hypothetical protein